MSERAEPCEPPRDAMAAVTHADPYPYYAHLSAGPGLHRDEGLGLVRRFSLSPGSPSPGPGRALAGGAHRGRRGGRPLRRPRAEHPPLPRRVRLSSPDRSCERATPCSWCPPRRTATRSPTPILTTSIRHAATPGSSPSEPGRTRVWDGRSPPRSRGPGSPASSPMASIRGTSPPGPPTAFAELPHAALVARSERHVRRPRAVSPDSGSNTS